MYWIYLLYGCGGFVNLASGFCGAGLREKSGKFWQKKRIKFEINLIYSNLAPVSRPKFTASKSATK